MGVDDLQHVKSGSDDDAQVAVAAVIVLEVLRNSAEYLVPNSPLATGGSGWCSGSFWCSSRALS